MDGDGLPILDAGHVLTALNKLDAGDPEEILLSSRDGKDLMVVSYADMQRYRCNVWVAIIYSTGSSYCAAVAVPSDGITTLAEFNDCPNVLSAA